jgi:hypothetical protein
VTDGPETAEPGSPAGSRTRSRGYERWSMKNQPETTRSQLALLAALARNRGELDASTLERLLRLVGNVKPAS